MRRLVWNQIYRDCPFYNVLAVTLPGYRYPPALHDHDFAEVFWIEHGSGLHVINGRNARLEAGDIVFIRPHDAHAIAHDPDGSITLVNFAFKPAALSRLRRCCGSAVEFPWGNGPMPAHHLLGMQQLAQLREATASLSRTGQTRLELDWFLMSVLRMLTHRANEPRLDQAPRWLQRALAELQDPAYLCEGVRGLAALSDRNPEYVNRTIRRCLGKTATELVNELRMDHAARELQMTDKPIAQIANLCGLGNLGHFYKLFAHRFGMTPRQFRLRPHGAAPTRGPSNSKKSE